MPQKGFATTRVISEYDKDFSIPTDESVGAMLFDISGFDDPFINYPDIHTNFGDGKIVLIHSMLEAIAMGVDNNNFLNGMLYYHLSSFYDYVGKNHPLYIALADCSKNWDVIESIQRFSNGRIFQVGVWTHQPIWKLDENGKVIFTNLLTNIQDAVESICGKVGESTFCTTPLSVMLYANTNYINGIDSNYRLIPEANTLNFPKISIFIAQNGSDKVHQMQFENPLNAPVGALGFTMACLALCGAEGSIGATELFNLNKNDAFSVPELGIGEDFSPLSDIGSIWLNTLIYYGYIVPVQYEELESEVFFSGDTTLSLGDYRSISNNRIIHKCRRTIYSAWLPHINSHYIFDYVKGTISDTYMAMITNSINSRIARTMKNRDGNNQINNIAVNFTSDVDDYKKDAVKMEVTVYPINYNSTIEESIEAEIAE